jgi:EAL domain-containing protein (putative c-di-GMP-specific phosphodiesterase class I)
MMHRLATPGRRSRKGAGAGAVLPALADSRLRHGDRDRAIRDAVADVLAEGAVRVGFQPVVDLAGGGVVGWEALARGPHGTPLERPDRLFAAARAAGRLDELDWLCQRLALQAALRAGLHGGQVLFLNVEPGASGFMPLELRTLYAQATAQMTVAVEVTERALTERPADLLGHVADMRALGCAVALDDVGAEAASLAMLPVLAPDVIKLDLHVLLAGDDRLVGEIAGTVSAHAERPDVTLLVERVEDDEEARMARAFGARLVQGWLYGRRGPLAAPLPAPGELVVHATARPDPRDASPFALLSGGGREPRRGSSALIRALAARLVDLAERAGGHAILLGAFGAGPGFVPAEAARWSQVAATLALCGAVGPQLGSEPAPGVRGRSLPASDPTAHEWAVAVVAPHFAAALSAHDLGAGEPPDERYAFVLTHDRELAVGSAAALMARL